MPPLSPLGLQALVSIQHQEPTDQLGVNGLAGDDD